MSRAAHQVSWPLHRINKQANDAFQVALGIIVMLFMPSYPEKASWLTEEEKKLEIARLGENSSQGSVNLDYDFLSPPEN